MGFTLNNMTLLAITLAVGIVIDDAIVVLENIFRYIEEKNCTPFEAAIAGTREVALAVMATTLSLVVIFLPIAFMDGYAKRFINPFGWTMAFAILVSMLVSFTLTPMLSSRFLKLCGRRLRQEDQGARVLPLARRVVHAAGQLGARSSDGDYRDLGRHRSADDSAQPHGRPRVRAQRGHGRMDGPRRRARGHVARGHDRDRVQAAEGAAGHRRRRATSSRRSASRAWPPSSSTHIHFLCQALPIEERKNTQAEIITEMRRRLAAHPGYRPSITSRNALGSGEGPGGSRSPRISSDPTCTDRRLFEARARCGAERPEHHRSQDQPQRLQSRGPCRRRSQARRRSRRAHGDDWQHASAGGLGRRSDLLLQGRAGAVSGQDARAREPTAATSRQIGRLTVPSRDRSRPHRQHRAARARPRTDDAAALEPPVHGHPHRRRRARARARRGVERRPQDARRPQHAADDVVPAAGAVEDPRRDDGEPDHGDQPGDDLRLHGAGVAVRELPAADRHHAGAADLGAVRALHAVGDRPHAEPVERARHAAPPRHRQEELDPAGRLRQRAARPGHADARGDRRVVPHAAAADSDDDDARSSPA